MDNSSSIRESEQDIDGSENDKASSKGEKEANLECFNEFMQLIEPDEDISGSFVCSGESGDSETSILGKKIKFFPKRNDQ